MNNVFDTLAVIYKYKKLYERHCQGLMKEYDLRIADLDVLYYVSHSGHKNLAKDIVDEGMSKANVSKSVEHLRQKGLVELCADKEDRRCVHIEPTGEAEEIIIQIERIRKDMGASMFQGISEEDGRTVARVLHQLSDNLSNELCEVDKT